MNNSDYIAIASLIIAVFTFLYTTYNNHGMFLDVIWDDHLNVVPLSSLRVAGREYKGSPNEIAHIVEVEIINPNNFSLGYFALKAINPRTHQEHPIMMQDGIEKLHDNESNQLIYHGENQEIVLFMPKSKTGYFPANSVTVLHLVVTPYPNTVFGESLEVGFKIARISFLYQFILKFFKSKPKYEYHHKIYELK